jgi:hypothetical protein
VSAAEEVPDERATLRFQGEELAEAWFATEGERTTLIFRIRREHFEDAEQRRRLTYENLLTAAAVERDEIESWQVGDGSETKIELSEHLSKLPPSEKNLTIRVRMKPPQPEIPGEQEASLQQWQALEVMWKTILGLEASIDSSRLGMDGLRAEMETAFKRSMTVEEKLNALQSDVAQWNKAKTRVHHALPKVREFVHRATWALAQPERKKLEVVFKNDGEPRDPAVSAQSVREQLEHLQKERQVLFAQGNAVYQECRGILGEIQRALGGLQRNAADNARRKRSASREKGKHF